MPETITIDSDDDSASLPSQTTQAADAGRRTSHLRSSPLHSNYPYQTREQDDTERSALTTLRVNAQARNDDVALRRPGLNSILPRPVRSKSGRSLLSALDAAASSDNDGITRLREAESSRGKMNGKSKAKGSVHLDLDESAEEDNILGIGPSSRTAFSLTGKESQRSALRSSDLSSDLPSSPVIARTISAPTAPTARKGKSATGRAAASKRPGVLSHSDTSDDDNLQGMRDNVLGKRPTGGAGRLTKRSKTIGDLPSGPSETSLGKQRQKETVFGRKEIERMAKERENQEKKAERERHLEEKRQWQEANKLRTSKSETTKELIIEMDSGLFTAGSGPLASLKQQLLGELEKDGATTHVKDRVYDSIATAIDAQEQLEGLHAIRILRKRTARIDPVRRSFVPLPKGTVEIEDEKTAIVCLTCHKLLSLVEDGNLISTLRSFRQGLGLLFHQVVILVQGLGVHFRKMRNKSNREYTAAVRQQVHQAATLGAATGDDTATASASRRRKGRTVEEFTVTREQLDRELMKLRVAERCFVVQVEKSGEVVQWIVSIIQDVGIRPYKLIRNSHLSFAVDTKVAAGLTDEATFSAMLQQIPRMTEPQADSIVYTFATMRNLMDSIHSKGTASSSATGGPMNAAIQEIADCTVSTTKDGKLRQKGVRVGDALAKRLVMALSSTDPLTLMS
ncbi:hypothetical protein K437DRAFT_276193 [Tilletiaria anomala UBC 951]|uniref:Uncharacterized protein n=1 Tax=Tilletiaria anomala (strain ATCC 24038 / CBS 436.72 / UBC 951) TaxID=1037660 RepID=A0A066VBG5_TILAU|nr:uncharacterized protein K437DRAFT_276193 [Tilletiaria anomala UBC 951]KDN38796.1 hypothetical protein K437DRAFT_276193 [Tilletiaria anomala UBC 951]